MKKIGILTLFVMFCIGIIYSCEGNDNSELKQTENSLLVQKNAALVKLPKAEQERIAKDFFKSFGQNNNSENKVRGFCHTFTVHVNIGIFEVEGPVKVCCTTLTMNCPILPDVIINKRSDEPAVNAFEILDSSVYTSEDGEKFKIKNGIYEALPDGSFQLEIIEVK